MNPHPTPLVPRTVSLPPPPIPVLLPLNASFADKSVASADSHLDHLDRRATTQTALFKQMFSHTGYPHWGLNE